MTVVLTGMAVLGALAGPLRAAVQEAATVYRLGLLHSAASGVGLFTDAFREGMRERGYVEGKNYVLEIHARERKTDQLSDLAAELVRRKVVIILTAGQPALRAAEKATSTIPIVMMTGIDPVRRGIVASLANPGGNITGVLSRGVGLNAKRLGLIAETVPGVTRVAILTASRSIAARKGRSYKDLEAAARALGIELQILGAQDPGQINEAFLSMIEAQAEAVLVIAHSRYLQHAEHIVQQAAKHRLPTVYSHTAHVEAGGLITYGTDYTDLYRRMATYVDRILKGANPGKLPIEQPTKLQLVINLKTAKQLGITIPPSVLYQADRVIK